MEDCDPDRPWMDLNLVSMLSKEFATATVLISFGVLLGTTSPIQIIVMSIIEIVLFNANEIIGRTYLGAVDAGDTIFVHMFGAYFGLSISRVLYDKVISEWIKLFRKMFNFHHQAVSESTKASSDHTSDLFSMLNYLMRC